ncbi:PDCD5-related protein [Lipomyces tetrasporus]
MDDAELQAIRQARMAELQRQQPSGNGATGGRPGGSGDSAARQPSEDDARAEMIAQILTPAARERLSRIRIVRQQKAKGVEDLLIQMARTGQIRSRVDEDELISLLEQISKQESREHETKIVVSRYGSKGGNGQDILTL